MFVHYVLFISPFSSLFSNSLRCLEVKMHDTSLPACIAKFQCHIRRSELFPQSIRQYVPFHLKTTFLVKHGLEKFLITVTQNAKSGLTSTVEPPLIALSRGTGKCPLNGGWLLNSGSSWISIVVRRHITSSSDCIFLHFFFLENKAKLSESSALWPPNRGHNNGRTLFGRTKRWRQPPSRRGPPIEV